MKAVLRCAQFKAGSDKLQESPTATAVELLTGSVIVRVCPPSKVWCALRPAGVCPGT